MPAGNRRQTDVAPVPRRTGRVRRVRSFGSSSREQFTYRQNRKPADRVEAGIEAGLSRNSLLEVPDRQHRHARIDRRIESGELAVSSRGKASKLDIEAPGNFDRLRVDPKKVVGQQVGDHPPDILGFADSSERSAVRKLPFKLWRNSAGELGPYRAG